MKLGLLLALTGAALMLNLSEGRIVSKCELRKELQQVLPLPRKYGKYKDQILALVTCELERRSQLDSNLVNGNAVLPTLAPGQTTTASDRNQTATEQDIDPTISAAPMIDSTVSSLRRKRWASMKDFRERSDKKQGKKGQGSENNTEESHQKKNSKDGHKSSEAESHEMEIHGTNKPTASSTTTEMSNGVSGNQRQKRGASSKENDRKQKGNNKGDEKKQGKKEQGRDKGKESDNSSEESHGMENHAASKPTASSTTTDMSNGVSGNQRQKRGASSKENDHKQKGNKTDNDKKKGKKEQGRDKGKESDNSSEESHGMENHGANRPTVSSITTEISNGVSGNSRQKREASSEKKDHKQKGNKTDNDKKQGKKEQGRNKGKESDNSSDESHETKNNEWGHGSFEAEVHKMENNGANKPTPSSRTTEMSYSVSGNQRQKRDASSEEKGHKKQDNKEHGKKGRGSDESEESDHSSEKSHEMENHGTNKPTVNSTTTEMSNGVSGNQRPKRDASSKDKGHKKHGKKGRDSDEGDSSGEESHEMKNPEANKPTVSSRTTDVSNSVSGNPRQKRDASFEERRNKRQDKKGRGNMKQGDKRGSKGRDGDESNESVESKQKNMKEKKNSEQRHESSHEKVTMEQNQGPSIYFGLFQLSDSFCDSGNGLSKNLCNQNCSAFIDDNIKDDLECFAYKGYWRSILDRVSSSCYEQQDTYFDECF